MVVPMAAGGTADFLPRVLGEVLREKWKQTVVVENRPGAGGNLGTDYVARAKPDGYTLLITPPGPLVVNQSLYDKLSYDPASFVPITVLGMAPTVLDVSPNVKANTVQDLIKLAKEKPGTITYATQGAGSTSHLTAVLFEIVAGVKLVQVPYKGSGPALNDLMGGHVDLMFDNIASSLPLHRGGKLRILAVADSKRAAVAPEIPTMAEAGVANLQSAAWFGLVAPPHTPADIAEKINRVIVEALAQPDVRKRFHDVALDPVGNSPAEMVRFMESERARWAEVIKAARIKLE
jgi:tripartite-type tricarboxylate transporter receptor subunit TctC